MTEPKVHYQAVPGATEEEVQALLDRPISPPARKPDAALVETESVETVKSTLAARGAILDEIEAFIRSRLRAGEDFGVAHERECRQKDWQGYGRCPSCHRNPDLRLGGAERLAFALGYDFAEPEIATDVLATLKVEEPWIAVRVRLVRRATGEIVATGFGARRLRQDQGDPNKAMKMAAKSARVDVVKTTFALSSFFTQDGEEAGDAGGSDGRRVGARAASPEARPEKMAQGAGPAPPLHPAPAPAAPSPGGTAAPAAGPSFEEKVGAIRERLGLSWDWIYALARTAGAKVEDDRGRIVHRVTPHEWEIVYHWLTEDLKPRLPRNAGSPPEAYRERIAEMAKEWIRNWTGWDGTTPAKASV